MAKNMQDDGTVVLDAVERNFPAAPDTPHLWKVIKGNNKRD
jgi:hypothetical protein